MNDDMHPEGNALETHAPAVPGERPVDLGQLREKLAAGSGPAYWRSLEEAAETAEFREFVHREFPSMASEWDEGVNRRRFVQLMGASVALAGATACTRQPIEKIVPYVKQPEELVPGRPLYFATSLTLGGYAAGVLVESHQGRPTKIEGNPEHPASLGATDPFAQASILDLYDPDRLPSVQSLGRATTWKAFAAAAAAIGGAQKGLHGEGLRILTQTVTSPSLAAKIRELLAAFPKAKWHQWEPAGRHAVRAGLATAFGRPAELRYDFTKADVVVTLDADPLTTGPGSVRYARDFAGRRRVDGPESTMNRWYAIESSPLVGASLADHRLALPPSEVAAFAVALAAELGVTSASATLPPEAAKLAKAAAKDLASHPGAGLVVAGESAPAELHVLAAAINEKLGNLGSTCVVIPPVEAAPIDQVSSIADLVADLEAGKVDTLVVLHGNPAFDAPADLPFATAAAKAKTVVRLGLSDDETTALAHWAIPAAHDLESWGDARAFDGTISIQQPLIEPLYDGRTALQVVAAFLGQGEKKGDELVRDHWKASAELGGLDFEAKWRRALHDGLVAGTAFAPVAAGLAAGAADAAAAAMVAAKPADGALEVAFRPDPTIHDGRFANNGWLQELPKPLTKLTWDNPALLSPKTATEKGLANGDVVKISLGDRTVELPVWILPGHADRTITLSLGYGRARVGRVGAGTGVDVYPARTAKTLLGTAGATLAATGARVKLAATEGHFNIDDAALRSAEARERGLVRVATLSDFREHGDHAFSHGHGAGPSIYPDFQYKANAWGLAIDLNVCSGCNGCVVACQAENNIPVVGKDQVLMGREMHWIRIDRYYGGDLDLPTIHHQPVMCMHCEQAPCEVVCPVAATVHSDEGLNDMVYNRCVGTRYCSNNCPYKVRRFNFHLYSDFETPVLDLMRNPDVTVRSRGVMEKCTYCVQRINSARIEAEKDGRPIKDGEITTACQQACPTEAIVFGNLNDPESRLSRTRRRATHYGLLEELNTRPRTTYLGKLTNPNPELENA